MNKYFIETSVIIAYLRGDKGIVDFVGSLNAELSSSFVALAELYEGVERSNNQEREERGVLNFFSGMSEVYGIGKEWVACQRPDVFVC